MPSLVTRPLVGTDVTGGTDDTAIIRAENLNKFYGPFQALKNINLTVRPQERMVICGPAVSGKSVHDGTLHAHAMPSRASTYWFLQKTADDYVI